MDSTNEISHQMAVYQKSFSALPAPIRIEDHLSLVRKIAWHVHSSIARSSEVGDLIQTGLIALIEAARNYEYQPDALFTTYASIRIRGAMIDYLRRQTNICRSGMIKGKKIALARKQLHQELGRPPTGTELADRLGMPLMQLERDQEVARGVTYEALDEVYSDHALWFADDSNVPDAICEQAEVRDQLARLIKALPEREAQVLQLYYVEELNLHEIGMTMGIKAARVCQIKKSALDKLRTHLSEYVL